MLTSNTPIRKTKGTATFVVASSGASAKQKQLADYVCDGTADEVEINAAIVATAASGGRADGTVGCGGEVHLLAGSYYIAAPIVMLARVSLIGHGNLQSVRINGGDECGHGIYFKAWDAANSSIGVDERGQFTIANVNLIMSLTQSAASWGIYIDNDGTEYIYDCIFDNVYCGQAKTGGMYVAKEWASHYDNCTFETGSGGTGPGFKSDGPAGSVFNGCYFAHNVGHGCHLAGAGSANNFTNCGFADNGDSSTASHGLYLDNASLHRTLIVNCSAVDNWGSGFYISAGTKAFFTSCLAYRNNWDENWDKAGFRIGGSSVKYCSLINCLSIYNDGENAGAEDHGGNGYLIVGGYTSLIGCQSGYNEFGVTLWNTSFPETYCDVRFTGGDTNKFRHLGGLQNSIGRTCVDTLIDVAVANTTGIKAGIVNTTPVTSMDGQMAHPRNVTVTGDGSADGVVKIQGITADGKVFDTTSCDEEITVSAGSTVQGNIAWSKITKITRTTANGSVDVGWGDKLGLSNIIRESGDVYKVVKNGAHINTPAVNADYATVDCSTINANDDFVIYYKGF